MTGKRNLFVAAVLISFVAGSSWAAVGISESKHDFTSAGSGAAAGTSPDICGPCHVPHQPKQNVPLWSHTPTASAFYLYNANPEYSGDNEAAYDAAFNATHDFIGSQSRACLSCHDGTLAANQDVTLTSANAWILWDDGAAVTVIAGESTGLMGSHPVGVDYNSGTTDVATTGPDAAEYLDTPTAPVILENNKVQCISCHNAHNVFEPGMLVGTNDGSALCLSCHDK